MVLINKTDRRYWSQAEGDQYWIDAEVSDSFERLINSWQYPPSSYQRTILEWLVNGSGNGCCNAVAGSGKSSTLRMAGEVLEKVVGLDPHDIKVIVFGKANSLDLVGKFGKRWEQSISTLHSAGWSLLKRHLNIKNPQNLIKGNKYKAIAQELGYIAGRGRPVSQLKQDAVIGNDDDFVKLLDLVRLTNNEPLPELIKDICLHFEISEIYEYSVVASAIFEVLQRGESLGKQAKSFDFVDQIWLPVKWQLTKERWFSPYKFVLIDECQDLNAIQLELAVGLAGGNGRILAVGDPAQAIMGFSGADNRSYQKITQRLKAKELPLSICYRCPSSHIKLAKRNFSRIPLEASPGAIEGHIEAIAESDLWNEKHCKLVVGDMVISRKTAPLVNLCIKLIARGIAATVKGKAIGEQIKGDLAEIGKMPNFTYDTFNDAVNLYRLKKSERYAGLDNEEQLVEALKDKLEALTTIYKSQPQASSIQELGDYIDSLFSDDHSPVTLSTCHRAKGLEGDRIFIIKPEDMPMTWRKQQDWQYEQEENLLYVALTRSKRELYIVGSPDWLPTDEKAIANEATPQPSTDNLVVDQHSTTEETFTDLVNDQHSNVLETEATQLAGLEEALTHCHGDWYGTAQVLRLIREELKADFTSYCKDKFGWSKRHCDRLIAASITIDNLMNAGLIHGDIPAESVIRPIANLTIDQQLKIWQLAQNYDRITAQLVEQLKAEVMAKTVSKAELIDQLINKFGIEYLVQMLQCNSEEEASDNTKSFCKGCGAEIIWVKTKTGKLTPNNLDGTTHWATCTHAKEFKR